MQTILEILEELELEFDPILQGPASEDMQPELITLEMLGLCDVTLPDFREALQDTWNIRIPEVEMESWSAASDIMDSVTGRLPNAEM